MAHTPKNGQVSVEIEIAPEMIEAGCAVLLESAFCELSPGIPEDMVREIYGNMRRLEAVANEAPEVKG